MNAGPTLNPTLDAAHRRIDRTQWDNIYVVGDVHGCRGTLEQLLETLDPSESELVVFVGDLVRKGPDSKGVVDIVRDRPNLVSVRGNNEQADRRPQVYRRADRRRPRVHRVDARGHLVGRRHGRPRRRRPPETRRRTLADGAAEHALARPGREPRPPLLVRGTPRGSPYLLRSHGPCSAPRHRLGRRARHWLRLRRSVDCLRHQWGETDNCRPAENISRAVVGQHRPAPVRPAAIGA
ncbi:metallophosphoesterase [Halomicroarcula sp. GCM10025710]